MTILDQTTIPVTVDATAATVTDRLIATITPAIDRHLHAEGAILIHTRCIDTVERFEQLVSALSPQLMTYDFGSTPRSRIAGRVYSSTEYPADYTIGLHNEMSYTTRWPSRIWFYCHQAAQTGGETPIADSRAIYRRIDPAIRRRFEDKGLLYVRNYRPELDVPWQKTFNTESRAAVEEHCRAHGISFHWSGEDELTTRQVCQATTIHPVTGEAVWFNQAHLFHASSLPPEYREALQDMFADDELPRNVLYADGTPIEDGILDEVRGAIEAEKRLFPWRNGDVLMLDNVLVAHGREPFSGPRRVAVAMA